MTFSTALILAWFMASLLAALRFGGSPERIGAAIILAWLVADANDHLVFGPFPFDRPDPIDVAIDVIELLAMGWLAIRANRAWPIACVAVQLVCVAGHAAVALSGDGLRDAYWALTQLPGYLQALCLLMGTLAHARRKRRGLAVRDWAARPAD